MSLRVIIVRNPDTPRAIFGTWTRNGHFASEIKVGVCVNCPASKFGVGRRLIVVLKVADCVELVRTSKIMFTIGSVRGAHTDP